jgi:hypothetical protein
MQVELGGSKNTYNSNNNYNAMSDYYILAPKSFNLSEIFNKSINWFKYFVIMMFAFNGLQLQAFYYLANNGDDI